MRRRRRRRELPKNKREQKLVRLARIKLISKFESLIISFSEGIGRSNNNDFSV
jgi:hypothetical protein